MIRSGSRFQQHGYFAGVAVSLSLIVTGLAWQTAGLNAQEDDAPQQAIGEVDFNRDIRPILSDTCYKCHGPDEEQRAADLRLDTAEGLATVVEAGDIENSELIARIKSDDHDLLMPPADSGRELTEEQIQQLEHWVAQGAGWQQHWSFIPPRKPSVPESNWSSNPIDGFVANRMKERGLEPNSRATKAEQLRRLSMDLTGLPPTPTELAAFLADSSDQAYEKQVDRLLALPAYGEHRARYWLDAARYGDTHGLHLDNYREMWLYRDWVVDAFNRNLPYDQFVIEQLAGDLLENPTEAQQIASGFNRCHITTSEGGAIAAEVDMRNVVDRTSTMGTVFMGLTIGCCVCHDHKYDPISQKEYYQLYAFFNSIEGNPLDGNAKDHPPVLKVYTEEQKQRRQEIEQKIAEKKEELRTAVASLEYSEPGLEVETNGEAAEFVWVDDQFPEGAEPTTWDWKDNAPTQPHSGKRSWYRQAAGLTQHFFIKATYPLQINTPDDVLFAHVYLDPKNPPKEIMLQWNDGSWEHRAYWGGNQIDWGQDESASRKRIGDLPEAGAWARIEVRAADVGLNPGAKINGWAFTQFDGSVQWDTAGIVTTGNPTAQYRSLSQWLADQATNPNASLPGNLKALVGKPEGERSAEESKQLRDYFLENVCVDTRSQFDGLHEELNKLEQEHKSLENSAPTTLVSREMANPKQAFVMKRGEYDQPGDEVMRETPSVLPPFSEELPKNRLGLAQWLTSVDHPLTARVAVNRVWQQMFGTGLVKTSEDFGAQGQPPSHPLLLDWLAVDFRENDWDVKRLIKQIVMSETYRQSCLVNAEDYKKDPENRLLSRGPRYRWDAETLRDQALYVAGLLSEKMGGPSVKPPQPDGLWFAVGYSGSNTVRFKKDDGHEKVHRRSLYTFWKRTSPPPEMTTFDAPSREECSVRRERTNTPLQALLLMNDPQYVEAARFFAQRILAEGGDTDHQRIQFAVSAALCRPLRSQEEQRFSELLQSFRAEYQADPEAAKKLIAIGEMPAETEQPAELAAWTMVANLIFNLDEFVCKK